MSLLLVSLTGLVCLCVIVVGEFDWVSEFMCRDRTVIVVGEF